MPLRTILFYIAFFCATVACPAYGYAQAITAKDTTAVHTNSARQQQALLDTPKGPFQPSPKKAGLYSAIVPGLGQIYNRQYWKLPIVYVGLGVAGYFINDNNNKYQGYRKAYITTLANGKVDAQYAIYDRDQLKLLQDEYRKFLNLSVLFTSLGYLLHVVDAVTSAHLKNFDISRDISMQAMPVITGQGAGMAMVFRFK